MKGSFHRGDLYYANLGVGVGSEQNGYRPVAIVQNDIGNRYSPTTIVAPLTTRLITKSKLPTHYHISMNSGLNQPSIIMLEQIRTIDKTRLEKYIGKLSDLDIVRLNHALAISVGLVSVSSKKEMLYLCSDCARSFSSVGPIASRKRKRSERKNKSCNY